MPYTNYFTNILLIDDDEDDRFLFGEALMDAAPSSSLCCLPEGDGLLEEIERNRPSMIFIDYKLPKEDGIEYVRRIKAHPVFQNIPVIMWSTSSMLSNVLAAYQAGVQDFFEKPWELNVLIQKLKSIIQLHLLSLTSARAFVSA